MHGSKPKLSVVATRNLMFLFTDTLEFIFVTSELVECGWNFNRWIKRLGGRGRFREYIRNYDNALKEVKETAQDQSSLNT